MKKVSVLCIAIGLWVMVPLYGMMMKHQNKYQQQRSGVHVTRTAPVWIRVSDGAIIQVPRWQIDQMQWLQVKLEDQQDNNSQDNPLDAPVITAQQLTLMQKAFQVAANSLDKFHYFCRNLKPDEKSSLINTAFTLQAQGLISLMMNVIFSPEIQIKLGATVAVSGVMESVIAYLTAPPEIIFTSHNGKILSLACSPDNQFIVSGAAGINNSLSLHNVNTGKEIFLLNGELFTGCRNVVYSSDGGYIAAISTQTFANFIIFDGKTGKQLEGIKVLHNCSVQKNRSVAFSPESKRLIVLCPPVEVYNILQKVVVCDVATGKTMHTFAQPDIQGAVAVSVSWNADNDIVICYSFAGDKTHVSIYNGSTYAVKKTFIFDRVDVLMSPNCQYIVDEESGEVVDTATGNVICTFSQPIGRSVCWSADSNYVIATSEYNTSLLLLSIATGKTVNLLKGYGAKIQTVMFSPDGKFIIFNNDKDIEILKFIDPQTLMFLSNKLNIAQARLLYRLYLAKINNTSVVMDKNDLDYKVYEGLPSGVQKVVQQFLHFTVVSAQSFEPLIQEKVREYRDLFYAPPSWLFGEKKEKSRDEKKAIITNIMKTVAVDSVEYKACQRLLQQLENEIAFDV
jgi:WD40 repeat protein